MPSFNVVFLGNHDVGITALNTLVTSEVTVKGVVAHPEDPEEHVVFGSVYNRAKELNLPVIRADNTSKKLANFIASCHPDLLWITDYRYLIPQKIIDLAPWGGLNLHPALLPKYRGRAPINWAIIHGEKETGLTAHFIIEKADAGDIVEQQKIIIGSKDNIKDVLNKFYPLYKSITQKVIKHFLNGDVPRRAQDHNIATVFPARTASDGRISWKQHAQQLHDFIRAITRPYPGAFSFYQGRKIMIWEATIEKGKGSPGQILEINKNHFTVACQSNALCIREASDEKGNPFVPPSTDFFD